MFGAKDDPSIVQGEKVVGVVKLQPSQAVTIYGSWNPIPVLNWRTVCQREDLDFKYLHYTVQLSEKQLFQLQPDKHEWIRENKIEVGNVIHFPSLKINALKDMHCTLPALAMLNATAQFHLHTGTTFQDMVHAGLTVHLMPIMRLSLMDWISLGITKQFVANISDNDSMQVFGLTKSHVLECIAKGET